MPRHLPFPLVSRPVFCLFRLPHPLLTRAPIAYFMSDERCPCGSAIPPFYGLPPRSGTDSCQHLSATTRSSLFPRYCIHALRRTSLFVVQAAMAEGLKESCKRILQRLQQQDVEEFGCVLCSQRVRGQDALMQHLITEHQVHCLHFDNVVDLPLLLKHLSTLLHSHATSPAQWVCPVCGEDTASENVETLLSHMSKMGHQQWTPQTIPSMKQWCIAGTSVPTGLLNETLVAKATPATCLPSSSSPRQLGQGGAGEGDTDSEWNDAEDEEVDEDEDWNLKCVCLYCDYSGEDVLQHLKTKHQFDFRASVQRRPDLHDEYDLIRVVNMVRRAVGSDRCPYGDACDVDGKQNDRAALEAHLEVEREHRLPQRVSTSDDDLIPVLPGDAFISMLVTSGEGFLHTEEEDPDFPMVPTVQELAAAASRAPPKSKSVSRT
ncbi:hypothetical protein, conserved [Leishmania tarentolae]|uniref:C2H2-type domain-containing protein n=1 Tax=Leishmania tarentolae TaxID=5689 RepID=A0A640KTJ5_LEITA|nr:hypothetical protein, conserved [Leishmania tarentolae]